LKFKARVCYLGKVTATAKLLRVIDRKWVEENSDRVSVTLQVRFNLWVVLRYDGEKLRPSVVRNYGTARHPALTHICDLSTVTDKVIKSLTERILLPDAQKLFNSLHIADVFSVFTGLLKQTI